MCHLTTQTLDLIDEVVSHGPISKDSLTSIAEIAYMDGLMKGSKDAYDSSIKAIEGIGTDE